MSHPADAPAVSLNTHLYGTLIRYRRIQMGYKKAEDFIKDLCLAGCPINKASFYRIERGEQAPSIDFLFAANLILYGNYVATDISDSCVDPNFLDPLEDDTLHRILKKNGITDLRKPKKPNEAETSEYETIMAELSSYDFDVFVNGNTNENQVFISIGSVVAHSEQGYEKFESFKVETEDDIERSIIRYLKTNEVYLPGKEIEKLINYANRKVLPELE